MFGSIGGPELILILIVALLVFGPRKLPEIGRTIGRALAEFRGITNEFRTSLEREIQVDELRRTESEVRSAIRGTGEAGREPPAVPRSLPPMPAVVSDVTPSSAGAQQGNRLSTAEESVGEAAAGNGSGDGADGSKA